MGAVPNLNPEPGLGILLTSQAIERYGVCSKNRPNRLVIVGFSVLAPLKLIMFRALDYVMLAEGAYRSTQGKRVRMFFPH